jgi:hypothetical protein
MLENAAKDGYGRCNAVAIVALGLGSVIFLSTILIVGALLLRNRWDDMGRR